MHLLPHERSLYCRHFYFLTKDKSAKVNKLRDPPFKTSANFSRFLIPTLPTVSSILLQSGGKFGKFLTPSPLNNADVLNGWSLSPNPYQWQSKRHKITSPNGCAKMPLIYDAVSAHQPT